MEKRYQIFISSTFDDLKEERQAVLRAILELDHMPAGMELFPASDEGAWQLIRDVIDASDYYVLIIGGRYGSLDKKGIGFTEKEYDYAIESSKAIVSLLHKNPNFLPRGKTETNSEGWMKLEEFRKKIEGRHTCVYWENADELKAQVILGLTSTIKKHPAKGWMRADKLANKEILTELLELRQKNSELLSQLDAARKVPPKGSENLVQGEDEIIIESTFVSSQKDKNEFYGYIRQNYIGEVTTTWNEIWSNIAPKLINEISDRQLRHCFIGFFESKTRETFLEKKELKNKKLMEFKFKDHFIDTCIVQYRALGYMKENVKQRSIKDTNTYWTLTPLGDQLMVQLRAIKKDSIKKKRSKGILAQINDP